MGDIMWVIWLIAVAGSLIGICSGLGGSLFQAIQVHKRCWLKRIF